MLEAGLKPLTYRLRTELGGEAWHWNSAGTWSDPVHKEGYWTSNSTVPGKLDKSYGYRLPRRGNSGDQANNDNYSRIDDGDDSTFWKSNPYLDQHFTGEDNALHPQWVVIDLEGPTLVNAVRINWGEPYAQKYSVEYSPSRSTDDIEDEFPSLWKPFPQGTDVQTQGKKDVVRLSLDPLMARYIRVLLSSSSAMTIHASEDIRDRVGFAIREIEVGRIDEQGKFRDFVEHGKKNTKQTPIYVSSTDPWHTEKTVDKKTEQPGFDLVFHSGLTNNLPLLLPVPVLYDTPENVGAEIQFLKDRGYSFNQVEMGEEPDGQYVMPEDYGALYIQMADAIHRVDPSLKLGGPGFQTDVSSYRSWSIGGGSESWMARFLAYLERRGRISDLSFFSFEWYPFDKGCQDSAPQLLDHPALLKGVMEKLKQQGLSTKIPWYITEYGYSAFGCRDEVDLEGALVNAETVGLFLSLGGSSAYLYGYEPADLMDELQCNSWGNNMILGFNEDRTTLYRTATYFETAMITKKWVLPGDGVHEVYEASSTLKDEKGRELVVAYPVKRPDGIMSVMLLNKDPESSHTVHLSVIDGATKREIPHQDKVSLTQFSREQYVWNSDGEKSHPYKSEEPKESEVSADAITLPPYSLSVVWATQTPVSPPH